MHLRSDYGRDEDLINFSNPGYFSSVVFPQPEVDSFASISEVDILRLRQYSYASGSLPKGDYCPEGKLKALITV